VSLGFPKDAWDVCIGRVSEENTANDTPALWLLRLPEVFAALEPAIMEDLGAEKPRKLGRDYRLVRLADPARLHDSPAAKFIRWNLPVRHMWPCRPRETAGFIEKAAQALWKKFGGAHPQTVMAGALDSSAGRNFYRSLASNLRGRTLQLFPEQAAAIRHAEDQDPRVDSLFAMVGEEGLFCGLHSPQRANGFHPGGTKFMRQSGPDAISRAGAKLAEALHHLALFRSVPESGCHWLELGASPGGMTAELLARGHRVTAVDRAPLDARLTGAAGLQELRMDVARFRPPAGRLYDAILCDMNGDARVAAAEVFRLAAHLRKGGLVLFTLKLAGSVNYAEINALAADVSRMAESAGLQRIALKHLSYNRHEFTMMLQRPV
jgi:23S rRNA (cytidine2498-2'-O)-methyltransferase